MSGLLYLIDRKMAFCFIAACVTAGCADQTAYRAPVSTFQDASSVMVHSARIYLTQLNKVERDAYIRRQAANNQHIRLNEIEKTQSFSPEEIAVRLEALNGLSRYGELLGQLANSDAPEKITAGASDLAHSLQKLSSDVSQLAEKPANNKFVNSTGPVVQIVGEVARIAAEKKIQAALDHAILAGEEPIRNLIHAIRDDITIAYERKRNALSAQRVDYVDAYEDTVSAAGNSNYDQRKQRADELIAYLDVWESFPLTNPYEGLNAMADAYSALVAYAKSPKAPTDLSSLADQVELFAARANRIGAAIQQLEQNY
ncbi:hypothetical protein [Methylobacter sp. YRD-M1]|uniref:hypothetical protein n=1 Tax=Methylobacter sp. YRD-M1 TaxID=2911520 RepID=UPI00227D3E51|nr:hypothetical protein [Methylobacter sp. YRD-M1]WAK00533.1 hypothetical protein LZ558_11785 [Methylobacter sp. YRD-M1]